MEKYFSVVKVLVKLKKSKSPRKSRKWVGRSSPKSDFFLEMLCFLCCFVVVVDVSKKKWIGGRVDVVWQIRVFLGFFIFF